MSLSDLVRSNAAADAAQEEHEVRAKLPTRVLQQGRMANRWAIGIHKGVVDKRDPYNEWSITFGPVADETKLLSVMGGKDQCIIYNSGDGFQPLIKWVWHKESWVKPEEVPVAPTIKAVTIAVNEPDITEPESKSDSDDPQLITNDLSYGDAIELIKLGHVMARLPWASYGSYVQLCAKWSGNVDPRAIQFQFAPFIVYRDGDAVITPWVPSYEDQLASDWYLLEPEAVE